MTDFNQKTHDTDVGSHGGQSRQMMEVFENQEFGSIRLLQEAGKTFFCASDVAKALGYVNPYAAVKRHCRGPLTKREGVVQKVNQYGDAGEQVVEISFITEGDVYRLIVHSKVLIEYADLKGQAVDFDPVELYAARQVIRPTQEKTAERQLEDSMQSLIMLLNVKQETSRLLGEDAEERQVRQMIMRRRSTKQLKSSQLKKDRRKIER